METRDRRRSILLSSLLSCSRALPLTSNLILSKMKKRKWFILVLTLIPYASIAFLIVASLLAPYLEHKGIEASQKIFAILGLLCHQRSTRSFWIFESPMGLCARCFPFYLSLLVTSFFVLHTNTRKILWKWGFPLLIPILLDGISQQMGLRVSTNFLRAITGLMGGVGIGILVFPIYFRLLYLLGNYERR